MQIIVDWLLSWQDVICMDKKKVIIIAVIVFLVGAIWGFDFFWVIGKVAWNIFKLVALVLGAIIIISLILKKTRR